MIQDQRPLLRGAIPFGLCGIIVLMLMYVMLPTFATQPAAKVLGRKAQRSRDRTLVATTVSLQQLHPYGDPPSRVEIRTSSGRLLASEDHSASPDQGYAVENAAWTADSRFFVYMVYNSGGHAPWHHPIFFYSRSRNRFYSLDRALEALGHGDGSITGGMKLRSPCTILTQGRYYGNSQTGLRVGPAQDQSSEPVLAIDLGWLIAHLERD